jgi:hypothetical protein
LGKDFNGRRIAIAEDLGRVTHGIQPLSGADAPFDMKKRIEGEEVITRKAGKDLFQMVRAPEWHAHGS